MASEQIHLSQSGGSKIEIRVPAQWGSRESCLPGVQTAAFCLHPHKAERERETERDRERETEREREGGGKRILI